MHVVVMDTIGKWFMDAPVSVCIKCLTLIGLCFIWSICPSIFLRNILFYCPCYISWEQYAILRTCIVHQCAQCKHKIAPCYLQMHIKRDNKMKCYPVQVDHTVFFVSVVSMSPSCICDLTKKKKNIFFTDSLSSFFLCPMHPMADKKLQPANYFSQEAPKVTFALSVNDMVEEIGTKTLPFLVSTGAVLTRRPASPPLTFVYCSGVWQLANGLGGSHFAFFQVRAKPWK